VRVCLVNEYFPPFAPGGAEWSVAALAQALAARGHAVVVVTPNYGAPTVEDRDGVTIERFPFPRHLPPGRQLVSAKWLANPLAYLYGAVAVTRIARKHRAEVIHVQNKHSLIPGAIAGRLLRIPVFLTVRDGSLINAAPLCLHRGDAMPPDCGIRKLWRECSEEYFRIYVRDPRRRLRSKLAFLYFWADSRLKQWFLRRIRGVIGVSHGILEVYRRSGLLRGVARVDAVYTIPPPPAPPPSEQVEALRAKLALDGRPLVLYVGKLSVGKGTPDLLAAARIVAREEPSAVFVLVGDGEAEDPPANVRRVGALPNADVLATYALADVVVVPSVIPDALSRVLLEAMAAGRAVVGTRVGGTPEMLIDGETGLLVPRASPAELSRAILRLLRDASLRDALGAAARAHVSQRCSADHSVDQLIAIYSSEGASAAPGASPPKEARLRRRSNQARVS
jgi:glycosyltransferase involved in cell wall biosynthesis